MGARSPDPGFSGGDFSTSVDAVGTTESFLAPLQDVLAKSDPDLLAKRLGLRSAAAAERLLAQEAACERLAERMAEGCEGLTVREAMALCRDLVGQGS
ncbi:MAG: hypothetical protein ACFB01_01480 [Cohaesibacteraceae bacterium]